MLCEFTSCLLCHRGCSGVQPGPDGNWGLHNVAVVRFSTEKDLWETEWVFSPLQQQQSGISQFNTSRFKNSASASQRLIKGHLVWRMKTWQQPELERLALFSYQRDPQPARLNLDFVWKSVSTAEILGPRAGKLSSSSSLYIFSPYILASALLTLQPIKMWIKVGKILLFRVGVLHGFIFAVYKMIWRNANTYYWTLRSLNCFNLCCQLCVVSFAEQQGVKNQVPPVNSC